jgi:hypothetical protein
MRLDEYHGFLFFVFFWDKKIGDIFQDICKSSQIYTFYLVVNAITRNVFDWMEGQSSLIN